MKKLLSIHLPSNKPHHFRRLVENLVATAADPACFQIVVKIDTGDQAMQQAIAAIERDIEVNLTVVVSAPIQSYAHTYIGFNECYRASDPEYYFCWHVNDEIVIDTRHWDVVLARYIDFFPDRVFRLKIDRRKMFHNFFALEEVCVWADYPIVPRRWLDATEGWSPMHGPDVYQEGVSVYLAKYGHHRNVPVPDIRIGGDDPGENMTPEKALARAQGTCLGWDRQMTPLAQESMARRARKLQLLIAAHAQRLDQFELIDERHRRAVALAQGGRVLAREFYTVDHVAIRFQQFDYIARRDWPWSLWGKSPMFKAAVHVYRLLLRVGGILLRVIKVPVGLAMGIPWRILLGSTIDPRWLSMREGVLTRWLRI